MLHSFIGRGAEKFGTNGCDLHIFCISTWCFYLFVQEEKNWIIMAKKWKIIHAPRLLTWETITNEDYIWAEHWSWTQDTRYSNFFLLQCFVPSQMMKSQNDNYSQQRKLLFSQNGFKFKIPILNLKPKKLETLKGVWLQKEECTLTWQGFYQQ